MKITYMWSTNSYVRGKDFRGDTKGKIDCRKVAVTRKVLLESPCHKELTDNKKKCGLKYRTDLYCKSL